MDKNLDAKLREIVDLAKKYEVINSSIKEKQNMLKQLDDVAKRIQGMPNVVAYANQAAEELKTEIASEEEMLEKKIGRAHV